MAKSPPTRRASGKGAGTGAGAGAPRRERAKRPIASHLPLSRESIARAALGLIDADGLEALSMRRLGAALGVQGMAIYHHFRDRGELLDSVVDLLLDEVEFAPDTVPVLRRLRHAFESYRDLAIVHPHAFVLLATRRFNTEHAFEFYERVLAMFAEAGFTAAESARWFRLMGNYAGGSGLADIAGRAQQSDATPVRLERFDRSERFPLVAAVAEHLRVSELDAVFAFGTQVIFDALERSAHGKTARACTAPKRGT